MAQAFLQSTANLDADHPLIQGFAQEAAAGAHTQREAAVAVFYAVRDRIKYNPYLFRPDPAIFRASAILRQGEGYCVQKSILLAASARALGIPCRLGFAIVRNHLTTPRLRALMQSDVFVFHGYNELLINGKWVKATPTFDQELCTKFGVKPLDFDGEQDALFHEHDLAGRKHMEYLHDYGTFADLPYEFMISELIKHYPHLVETYTQGGPMSGDFGAEAGSCGMLEREPPGLHPT